MNYPNTTTTIQSNAYAANVNSQKNSSIKNTKKVSSSKKSPATLSQYNNATTTNRLVSQKHASMAFLQNRQGASHNNTPDKNQKKASSHAKKQSINQKGMKENENQSSSFIGGSQQQVIQQFANNQNVAKQGNMHDQLQRIKNVDLYQQYSKSTKVSPNRVPNANGDSNAFLNQLTLKQQQIEQMQLNQLQNQQVFKGNSNKITGGHHAANSFVENLNKVQSKFLIENSFAHNISNQYSLRIPLNDKDQNQLNKGTLQLDLEAISPTIISQTQFTNQNKPKILMRKDSQGSTGTHNNGGHSQFNLFQATQDQDITQDRSSNGMDSGQGSNNMNDQSSNMHQSFINLIYPSMSKKIITTNQDTDRSTSSKVQQSHIINNQLGAGHHQKSKSVFTGGQNGFNQQFSQFQHYNNQMGQGVQKVNQSSYKKQANVFNYSQRLKELLNDNQDSNDQIDQTQENIAPRRHQIFSQQPSPNSSSTNILLNMNDIQVQEKSVDSKFPRTQIRSTFDNIVGQQKQFVTIEEQMKKAQNKQGLNTLDLLQNEKSSAVQLQKQIQYPYQKSNTQVNTPNNNTGNFQGQNSGLLFKPQDSQPVNPQRKNFQYSQYGNQQQPYCQQDQIEDSLQTQNEISNRHQVRRGSNYSQGYRENFNKAQQQQIQPVREKKQHQPTQSKILNNSKSNGNYPKNPHHQRSSSDYVNYAQIQNQNASSNAKLKKFLNSDIQNFDQSQSNLTIQNANQMDYIDEQQDKNFSQGITPKSFFQDQEKSNNSASFLQQYSQALLEAQIQINKQYLNGVPNKQIAAKKAKQLSFVDNVNNNSQTINQDTMISKPTGNITSSIYHQRKLSYQHPAQHNITTTISHTNNNFALTKKSPMQQNFILQNKDNVGRQQQNQQNLKRKISPKPNTNHQTIIHHTSKPSISTSKTSGSGLFNNSGKSNITTIKNSQIFSPHNIMPISSNLLAQSITHQIQAMQNSLNHQNNQYSQLMGQSQIQGIQSASAANIKNQKSGKDLKSKIIQNATKNYKDNLKQNSNQITYGKLNLQGMTSQIKKNIQSEKTSPRLFKQNLQTQQLQQQNQKKVTNISIDLSKGNITTNQHQQNSFVNHQEQYQQQQMQQPQRQYSKFSLQKSDSQTIQNEFMARKNSQVKPTGGLVQNTYAQESNQRDVSPNNLNIINNQGINFYPNQEHNIPNNTNLRHQGANGGNTLSGHRYSVQNSPQKNHSIFQKTLKQSHHLKTNSMSNITLNQQQQFTNYQLNTNSSHLLQQKPSQTIISPLNQHRQSIQNMPPPTSASDYQNTSHIKAQFKNNNILEVSANTPNEPSFADEESVCFNINNFTKINNNQIEANKKQTHQQVVYQQQYQYQQQQQQQHQFIQAKQQLQHQQNQQSNSFLINQKQNLFNYELSKIRDITPLNYKQVQNSNKNQVSFNEEEQPLTETERLLNQIRNNVIKQQNYQLNSQSDRSLNHEIKEMQKPEISARVSDASMNNDFEQRSERRQTLFVRKEIPPIITKQNHEDSNAFMYMTTDPNLSPYTKDKCKLQKMIMINFKKYNEPPQTTSEFYRIGRVLGRGAFGKVNLAAHKVSEQLVAIKSINKEFLKCEEDQKKKIMQEFAILKQSTHQSVVRLYDTFETSKHICFVMELCAGGDLLTYVRKRRKLKENIAKYFFKQIIEGLSYIHHSKLIVHRDIKLDNILLDANGKIKICDFGVSKQVSSETEIMSEQCGTPAYIAPEILKDKGYEGFKVDVWSAGVCLYAMLIGTVPFKAASMHELHSLIVNGKYEIKPEEKLSEPALNLIASLLEVDPKKRLSAFEVLSHPWLKDTEEQLEIFTQKEKDTIQKEYLSKNIDRVPKENLNTQQNQDTDVIFTEHNLDTKTNNNSLLKNASTKSIILAPFNSTISDYDEESEAQKDWPDEVKRMMVHKRCIKFAPKCKDYDRQYEQNNNADLDNGVYNNFANDNESENNKSQSSSNSQNRRSRSSSQDSLKKSFKETELSSDDEKAELQVEQAHEQKLKQQSELQEFENQIKNKYVKYQEPVEIIDEAILQMVVQAGIYNREYLESSIQQKEMNYATATYYLISKKQQIMQKLFSEAQDAQQIEN